MGGGCGTCSSTLPAKRLRDEVATRDLQLQYSEGLVRGCEERAAAHRPDLDRLKMVEANVEAQASLQERLLVDFGALLQEQRADLEQSRAEASAAQRRSDQAEAAAETRQLALKREHVQDMRQAREAEVRAAGAEVAVRAAEAEAEVRAARAEVRAAAAARRLEADRASLLAEADAAAVTSRAEASAAATRSARMFAELGELRDGRERDRVRLGELSACLRTEEAELVSAQAYSSALRHELVDAAGRAEAAESARRQGRDEISSLEAELASVAAAASANAACAAKAREEEKSAKVAVARAREERDTSREELEASQLFNEDARLEALALREQSIQLSATTAYFARARAAQAAHAYWQCSKARPPARCVLEQVDARRMS